MRVRQRASEDVERQADAEHAVAILSRTSAWVRLRCVVHGGVRQLTRIVGGIVSVRVPLPFLPAWLGGVGVDVSSSQRARAKVVSDWVRRGRVGILMCAGCAFVCHCSCS